MKLYVTRSGEMFNLENIVTVRPLIPLGAASDIKPQSYVIQLVGGAEIVVRYKEEAVFFDWTVSEFSNTLREIDRSSHQRDDAVAQFVQIGQRWINLSTVMSAKLTVLDKDEVRFTTESRPDTTTSTSISMGDTPLSGSEMKLISAPVSLRLHFIDGTDMQFTMSEAERLANVLTKMAFRVPPSTTATYDAVTEARFNGGDDSSDYDVAPEAWIPVAPGDWPSAKDLRRASRLTHGDRGSSDNDGSDDSDDNGGGGHDGHTRTDGIDAPSD